MAFPIAAALMAGATVVGGLINKSATSKATDAATAATTQNNALAREIYGQNSANLRPYIEQGNVARTALAGQIGLNAGPDWNAYLQSDPAVLAHAQGEVAAGIQPNLEAAAEAHYRQYGQAEGREVPKGVDPEPQAGPRPTFTRQADPAREAYTRPDAGARPTFDRPQGETFNFGLGDYVKTPGFDFQQQRGMDALKSDKTLSGLLRSGSAIKGALDFSQNLAMQDFEGERNFAYNNFRADQSRNDNIFAQDRAFGTGAFESDRGFQAGAFESDRGYGADVYDRDRQNRNNVFADDRAFGTGVYDADRGYAASRYDTRTNNLFNLSGQGMAGASALAGVGQNYLSSVSSNNNTQAGVTANAALAGAGQTNALMGELANAYGRRGSSYAPTAAPPGSSYNYLADAGSRYMTRSA